MRRRLSRDVRDILKSARATALLVTHNQQEALPLPMLAESSIRAPSANGMKFRNCIAARSVFLWRILWRRRDDIGQAGFRPRSGRPAAGLSGDESAAGALARPGDAVRVLLRPDEIVLAKNGGGKTATVVDKVFRGSSVLYTLELSGGERVLSALPGTTNFAAGERIEVRAEVARLSLFPGV